MTTDGPTLSPSDDGSARVEWDQPTTDDVFPTIEQVRHVIDEAIEHHGRIEALVAVDDERGQRIATWSGMRREGVVRGLRRNLAPQDHILYARLDTDPGVDQPDGFRSLLNSFLPRKRAIAQMLVRDEDSRVLLCQLTYKRDWDLPGGVVEVGESPRTAVAREVLEELDLEIPATTCALTDWLPPWGGWDDALCLVFDGGMHPSSVLDDVVRQEREIKSAAFCTLAEVDELCTDFTARRIRQAMRAIATGVPAYTESGVLL